MFPQVLYQVVAVRHLSRMRQCAFHRIRVSTGAIPADYVNFLMALQPGQDGFSGAIWQQIERLSGLIVRSIGAVIRPVQALMSERRQYVMA